MVFPQPGKSVRAQGRSSPSSALTLGPRPVSPAGRVPVELLRKIMESSMEGRVGDLDPTQPPLLYLAVSSSFATIAESIPSFWSAIEVNPAQFLQTNVKVIRKWLRRSGSNKLKINIFAPVHPDHTVLYAVLAAFIPASDRWQDLNLAIPTTSLSMLLSNTNAPLPSLERLTIAISTQPVLELLQTATRLQHVSLTVHPPMGAPDGGLLKLAWSQITHLNIQTIAGTIAVIWSIFTQCPRLLSLTVTAANNPSTPYIPFFPHNVFHSTLCQLIVIANARPGVIGYLLDGLYLPYLQDLQLHFTDRLYETHTWPRAEILSLRHRALPPLSRLSVMGKTISEEDLCDFVPRMKYLVELAVNDGTGSLVTQAVMALLPHDDTDVQRLREGHRQELIHRGRIQS